MFAFVADRLPQISQLYGFSPVCILMCSDNFAGRSNTFSQKQHSYLLFRRCFFSAGLSEKKNSITVFDLITAHIPINAQSSNFVGFRLQSL